MDLLFSFRECARRCAALLFSGVMALGAVAQTAHTIGGVVRARYEIQTLDGRSRFAIRNSRVWIRGRFMPRLSYYVSTDLCDQGSFQFLDAYGKLDLGRGMAIQAGQFRIPFGVDPFRGPGNYIFADRSFIGRDIDNIRADGVQASYTFQKDIPATVTLGVFSPNTITDQNHWSKTLNYALKAELPVGPFKVTGGLQTIQPDSVRVNMADACVSFSKGGLTAEAEYILEHYVADPFPDCHSYNVWVDYGIPLEHTLFNRLSFQARFDASTSHSSGVVTNGRLSEDHPARKRLTIGSTLGYVNKPVKCELQVNYQKYFYKEGYAAPDGRQDKVVAELIVLF